MIDKTAPRIQVLDRLEGEGEHLIEQFWHFGTDGEQRSPCCFQAGSTAVLAFEQSAQAKLSTGGEHGWTSPALGVKIPAPVVVVERRASLAVSLATLIDLSGKAHTPCLRVQADEFIFDQNEQRLW